MLPAGYKHYNGQRLLRRPLLPEQLVLPQRYSLFKAQRSQRALRIAELTVASCSLLFMFRLPLRGDQQGLRPGCPWAKARAACRVGSR